MPTSTKPKPKPDDVMVAWRSFSGNVHRAVKGQRFYANDPIVTEHPDHFISAEVPDSAWPTDDYTTPEPEPIGRVKLRVLPGTPGLTLISGGRDQSVFANGRTYTSGETFEAEGQGAEHLLSSGCCEIVKKLKPRKEQPKPEQPAAAPGLTTGLITGREEE